METLGESAKSYDMNKMLSHEFKYGRESFECNHANGQFITVNTQENVKKFGTTGMENIFNDVIVL